MLNINKTHERGYTVYGFEANNTDYDVLTEDGKTFTVYSSNKSRSGLPAPKVYDSLSDLAKRSKTFEALAAFIAEGA